MIFPVRAAETVNDKEVGDGVGEDGLPGMEVFEGHVPVPMVVPGAEYAGRKPWFFEEVR